MAVKLLLMGNVVRRLLKVREVAELTGVGYNTVIEWLKAGLPAIRPNGRRSHLIDPTDLEAFLQRHKTSRDNCDIQEINTARFGTKVGRSQPGEESGNGMKPWYAKYRH